MTVPQGYERPSYVPSWYAWWPGEDPTTPYATSYTIREANMQDADAVLALAHAAGHKLSRKTLIRWVTQTAYTIRLVCRNYRYPVAACASKTTFEGTRILMLYVAPPFAGKKYDERLLRLAAAALPECDTTFRVRQDDTATATLLRDLGWRVTEADREHDEWVFRVRLLGTGDPGGAPAAPPAGRDP